MVPSSICPPEGYRPVYQEVERGVFEVVNAYEGTYRYFDRPGTNRHLAGESRAPIVHRRTASDITDRLPSGDGEMESSKHR